MQMQKDTITETTEETEELSNIVKFSKPFNFEGTEYKEVDLSGVENLTGKDMIEAQKEYGKGNFAPNAMPEVDIRYTLIIAQKATKLPYEFFEQLPARECVKIRTVVTRAFFGEG